MARILTRPLFRKGGLSRETGILSGLDTPRRSYAQGSYVPRVGYADGPRVPPISDLQRWIQRFRGSTSGGGGIFDAIKRKLGTTGTQSGSQIASDAAKKVSNINKAKNLLKSSKFSEKGLMELGKRYAPKALNVIKGGLSRFPLITTGVAGEYITRPRDVDKLVYEQEGYGPWEGRFRKILDPTYNRKWMKAAEEHYKDKEDLPGEIDPIIQPEVRDPEKSLMDVYGENKGIIDEVMGSSDEDTKKSMWLQLAKFGAGLAAQPGGALVGAIGKAAEKPLEGVEATLAEKRKGEKDIKLMALQKTFKDMEQPDQVKLVKSIQKEYGFKTFKEAYDYITKPKRSSAEIQADNAFYRETAKELNVSTEGFRREMELLDEMGLGKYVGYFTRTDAKLPEKIKDRTNGEYYVNDKGKPMRWVDGKLYGPKETEFTKKIETKEA